MGEVKNDWHTGLTGDEDIPPFLEVKNIVPLTEKQRARLTLVQSTAKVNVDPIKYGTNLPRGVEDDPIAMAMLQQKENAKSAAKAERLAALKERKATDPQVKSLRTGLLDANHFGKVIGCPAKLVRRALRTTKAIPKPAWGWSFAKEDEARVIEVVKAWLAKVSTKGKGGKAKVTVASPKATIPPPGETVWSGKAKLAKPAPMPKAGKGAKAEKTKEAKKLVKAKKANDKAKKATEQKLAAEVKPQQVGKRAKATDGLDAKVATAIKNADAEKGKV